MVDYEAANLEPTTFSRYKGILERFKAFLGSKADRDLHLVTSDDIASFRDAEAKRLSRTSANISLKVLRMVMMDAVKNRILASSPAVPVRILKSTRETKRRPLTIIEIKKVLALANEEWAGVIHFGLYTGQRIGDIVRLTWRQVDMERGEVNFLAKKTGRRVNLPMAKPLQACLAKLPAFDDPDEHLFPSLAKAKRIAHVSNQFRELLVEAGLLEARNHKAKGKGRAASREVSEISFHSFRHSAVSFLKAAGVNDAMAREIVGHESEAVSRQYTHLTTEDVRRAIDLLPKI